MSTAQHSMVQYSKVIPTTDAVGFSGINPVLQDRLKGEQ